MVNIIQAVNIAHKSKKKRKWHSFNPKFALELKTSPNLLKLLLLQEILLHQKSAMQILPFGCQRRIKPRFCNYFYITKIFFRKSIAKSRFNICLCALLSILTLAFPVYASKRLNSSDKLPLKVYASVDKSKVTIGDRITYTITVKADRDIEVKFPEFAQNAGKFTISNLGSSQRSWFRTKTYKKWYVLNTYTTGRYSIPSSLIKYRKKGEKKWEGIYTNKVVVDIASVLDNAQNKRDIRDISGPVGLPVRIHWYIYLIILLAIGAVAALFYIKNRKKKEAAIPPRPAYEIAYEALEELKRKKYLEDHKFNLYYVELSNIVRKYLENRFDLRAPEMTTEEFLNSVKNNNALSYKHKELLRNFLLTCDLVKFAKYEPYDKEANLSFEAAKNLIDQTKMDSNL